MATSYSTPELQLSRTPQAKNTTEKVIRLKLDSDMLKIIEHFGGASHGVARALAWAAFSFLNSEAQGGTPVVDALMACSALPAKMKDRREIAELNELYNLPATEEETLAS